MHQRRSILISCDKHETVVDQFLRFMQLYVEDRIAAITAIVLTSIWFNRVPKLNCVQRKIRIELLPGSSLICKLITSFSGDRWLRDFWLWFTRTLIILNAVSTMENV